MSQAAEVVEVNEEALGDVFGNVFFSAFYDDDESPPPCLARGGLVNDEGKLIPTRETQVVKIEDSPPSKKVFAVLGDFLNIMPDGLVPRPNALSATFSNNVLSCVVFGPIERVNPRIYDNEKRIYATNASVFSSHGIHAFFGNMGTSSLEPNPPAQQERWGCTKVYIRDTIWTPADSPTTVTRPEDYTPFNDSNPGVSTESKPFFCCDFVTGTRYVQFWTYSKGERSSPSNSGSVTQLTLKSDGTIEENTNGFNITDEPSKPSKEAVERGREMLLRCNEILETNMDAIQWLETQKEVATSEAEAMFDWLDQIRQNIEPKPRKGGSKSKSKYKTKSKTKSKTKTKRRPRK
jgi:hypothetical protein